MYPISTHNRIHSAVNQLRSRDSDCYAPSSLTHSISPLSLVVCFINTYNYHMYTYVYVMLVVVSLKITVMFPTYWSSLVIISCTTTRVLSKHTLFSSSIPFRKFMKEEGKRYLFIFHFPRASYAPHPLPLLSCRSSPSWYDDMKTVVVVTVWQDDDPFPVK